MSDQLDRLETKIDKITDKLAEHSAAMAVHAALHEKNTKDLAEHIHRTNLLEEKLVPVEKHVAAVNTILKVIWFIASLAGILSLMLKLAGFI